eukprot:9086880-Alexandrium_andersonii.AAC.1
MPVGPAPTGSSPERPAAKDPPAPAASAPREVPEQVAKDAVAGLVPLRQQAQLMRTPSPERARGQAAREGIDRALSAFAGRETPARVGPEPDIEGQAADAEITNHLRQLGVQVWQETGPVGAR